MRRALWVLLAGACSVSTEPLPFNAPPEEDFRFVSAALGARCGSLDCHGGIGRNLRLYSRFGLRLNPDDIPGGHPDTAEEHAANYVSLLALEPEIMQRVVQSGGQAPERLTLFRKGRGDEAHVGGSALNGDADDCLVSWVSATLDRKTCFNASQLKVPPGFSAKGGTGGGGTGGGGTGGGGTDGGGTGGTGGGGTGGGGTGGGGTGGGGTGGTGGVTCAPGDFWPCDWDPNCKPEKTAPADHLALADEDCLSCHKAGGSAGPGQEFLFGGRVILFNTNIGDPDAEIGVRDGNLFYYTCADNLGFFFVRDIGQPKPNWDQVETRARGEFADKSMPEDKEHRADCNSSKCHGDPIQHIHL